MVVEPVLLFPVHCLSDIYLPSTSTLGTAIMRFSFGYTFAASLAVLSHVAALPYPFEEPRDGYTNIAIRAVDVLNDLGPQLSPEASIVLPTDPRFDNLTARYSEFERPTFVTVANPGIEADVAVIVSRSSCLIIQSSALIGTGQIRQQSESSVPRGESRARTYQNSRASAAWTRDKHRSSQPVPDLGRQEVCESTRGCVGREHHPVVMGCRLRDE